MKDFKYLRFLCQKLNEKSLYLQAYFIYSIEVSLFFSIIPRTMTHPSHLDKNYKIQTRYKSGSQYGLLHPSSSRTIFCSVPMDIFNELDKYRIVICPFSKTSSFTRGAFTSIFHGLGPSGANVIRHRGCPRDHLRIRCIIFYMLHSQYVTTIYPYKVELNFDGQNMFRP